MGKTAAKTAQTGREGLTVERRFTTPGVHPFDEVEWELRDAVIGDPDDPAFEQREVEFPATWSQNATNIVAQKYFRGPLGAPERERSVKQMIERVAGTIAGWGREGGYFATDADADAFEAELTHILLHQKSPPSTAPCGSTSAGARTRSAAPASSSRSTTTWSRSCPGTPRRGSSSRAARAPGSTSRRSAARWSRLSKGGTASGPVSFMRGADSWAGRDQVRRRHPPRGEDGRARRRPPRRRGLHLVQGQGGGEGGGAARRRLRHAARLRRTSPRSSTRTPTTRSA